MKDTHSEEKKRKQKKSSGARRHMRKTLTLLPIVILLGTGCGNADAGPAGSSNPVQTVSPVTIQPGQGIAGQTGQDSQGGTGQDGQGNNGSGSQDGSGQNGQGGNGPDGQGSQGGSGQNGQDGSGPGSQDGSDQNGQGGSGPDGQGSQSGSGPDGQNGSGSGQNGQDGSGSGSQDSGQNSQGSASDPAPTPEPGPEPDTIFESDSWWLSYGESGTQPRGNAKPADLAWYGSYYVGGDSEKVVYLTFDCGYENGNTELILDALKNHNAKGTFFVVGHFLDTAPDLLKRMVEEGHAVGNHTYHHPDMSAITDPAAFQKELDDVADQFREITGAELSKFYRPPEGKCTKENLRLAKSLGYHTIFWSLAHVDWMQDKQPDAQESIDRLSSRVHPGAIVLLHNTSDTNGKIIDDLLTKWEEMGYSFRPLSDLTDPAGGTTPDL